jgi:hypothetical protein
MDEQMPDDYELEPEAQAVEQAEQADEKAAPKRSSRKGKPVDPENRYSPKCEAARAVVLAKLRAAGR